MWSRADLKSQAKLNVKAFYWKSVLVALILQGISTVGGGGSGRGSNAHSGGIAGGYYFEPLTTRGISVILGLALVFVMVIVIASIAIDIFLINPLRLGCKKYFLDASYGKVTLKNLGYAFKNNYWNQVAVLFLQKLFILLWSLLLIVPGIIKAYEYRMIPYIMSENPNLSFNQAKSLSSEMMMDQKWNAFVLDFSFILWHMLSAVTLGIVGIFWVGPYTAYTDVELYKALSTKHSF